MRLVLVLCIVMLCMSVALAAPDVIFDKSISHGFKLTLNETVYETQIGMGNHSLVKLVSDEETINVESGTCVERGYDTFCYEEYLGDQKIRAILTDYRPYIEVDREVTSKRLDLGEESTISITFENTGGTDITDFEFRETIPSMLSLQSASNCIISKDDDQKIIFKEKLYMDTPVTCEYVVQAGDVGIATYEGKLYTDVLASSRDAQAIPQVSITTKNVFNLDINVSMQEIEVGQPFVMTFSIENIEKGTRGDNLSIDEVVIYLEDELEILKIFDSSFDSFSTSNRLKFSGVVPAETTWEQKVEMDFLKLQENISIEVFVRYQLGTDEEKSFRRVIPLTQSYVPLYCEYIVVDEAGNNLISLDKLNHTLPGYDRGELFVYVYNENLYVPIDSIRSVSSGDLNVESEHMSALRKNDEEILTSLLFNFDKLDSFTLKSTTDIDYKILGTKLETSCEGAIFVEKPTFLDVEKEISFLNVTLEDNETKLIPHVKLSLQNNFFLPLSNIQIIEILPTNVFTNNNTNKLVSLGTLDESIFEYDFIIPVDYVSIDDNILLLNTNISYSIYDKTFTELVPLQVNVNDVLSAQQGVLLDSLIDAKVQQLTKELNDSLIESIESEQINQSDEPVITYSPFLDYFSTALFVFLLFLAILFLNIRYGLSRIIKKWFIKKRVQKIVKEEHSFAKKYDAYKLQEGSHLQKIEHGKKVLKALESEYKKKQKTFKKKMKILKSKEMKTIAALDSEHRSLEQLEHQKSTLENKMSMLNREIVASQAKKENILLERSQEKAELDKKQDNIKKAKEFISHTESQLRQLDSYLESMKSDFEKSYSKNTSVLDSKLKKVQGDISHLDDEYASKRKLLKEEEKHLEQRES